MVDKCFLTVPTKRTDESGFLAAPLKKSLAKEYTKQSSDHTLYAIKELEGLRRNAVGRVLDRNEASLEIIYKYYDQLGSLENRFPSVGYQIPFNWMSAFDKTGIFSTHNSLAFEKMCVLFNVAAMMSQVAGNQDLDIDDGLKLSMKYFQLASGTFQFIKDHVVSVIPQGPTPDFTQDTLDALVALMLAQAQEVCFMKAAKDQMKDSVIAKVAAQTGDYYAAALKLMQKDQARPCWDKDWIPLVAAKQAGFLAIAHYYQSLVHKAVLEYGEELSHLKAATDLIVNSRKCFDTVHWPFRNTELAVQRAHESAKRDNDFIYHVVVPEAKKLAAIPRASLVKQVQPAFPLSHGFIELFHPLVPNPTSSCTIC
ncbi:Programmed cell death 6-interacting protein [Hypsibius exemplaris]|uniref:Programmed cell death 6-interacting protein n=1 Tax=Hypsibius exemplaris TaxID=2072580 RepID=A0A9X6RKD1_HYPEX|nr:Programmed cell death 6-interacting protein [Hypsibius exemplaris]